MPRYSVTIQEIADYVIPVEAANTTEAGDVAHEKFVQSDMNQWLSCVHEREITDVTDITKQAEEEGKKAKPVKQLGPDMIGDIAQLFSPKLFAFVAVIHQDTNSIGLGIAVANEPGYNPVPSGRYTVDSYDEASEEAERLNREILNLSDDAALRIIGSTMHPFNSTARLATDQ